MLDSALLLMRACSISPRANSHVSVAWLMMSRALFLAVNDMS